MKIFKFKEYLFESKGVAIPTLNYISFIIESIKNDLFNFIESTDDNLEKNITLDCKRFSTDLFPISEIKLNISFCKYSNEKFSTQFPIISNRGKFFTSTGYCEGIPDHEIGEPISIEMGCGAIIDKDKFNIKDIESVYLEMESALSHEFNHAYESYNRIKKGYPEMSGTLTNALDCNVYNVPESVWHIWWKELGYYIYWTESFEVNAMIQDAFPYSRKYSFEDIKNYAPSWDFYERMKSFDYKEFKNRISNEIKKTMDEDPEMVLTNIKNGLANKIEEENDNNVSIKPSLIRKMNIDQFLKYCSNRIKNGSERLRRGIIRHYIK